jgi:TonB family protein
MNNTAFKNTTLYLWMVAFGISTLFVTSVNADDGKELLGLARRYQNKYPSEMPEQLLFSREFTVRIRMPAYALNDLQFDDDRQLITFSGANPLGLPLRIIEECTRIGSVMGTTALGAKVNFTKSNCEFLDAKAMSKVEGVDTTCLPLSPSLTTNSCKLQIAFSGTPSDFRLIKNKGLDVDIRLKLFRSSDPTFTSEDFFWAATFDRPYQKSGKSRTVAVSILGHSWVLPGGKKPVLVKKLEVQTNVPSPKVAVNLPKTNEQLIDEYKDRITDKISRFIVQPPNVEGNAEVEFNIIFFSTGNVIGAKLRASSGNSAFDNAVERAINRAQPLPMPMEPELLKYFRELTLKFKSQP